MTRVLEPSQLAEYETAGSILSPWTTLGSTIGWLKLSWIAWVTGTLGLFLTAEWTVTEREPPGKKITDTRTSDSIARPAMPMPAPSARPKRRRRRGWKLTRRRPSARRLARKWAR